MDTDDLGLGVPRVGDHSIPMRHPSIYTVEHGPGKDPLKSRGLVFWSRPDSHCVLMSSFRLVGGLASENVRWAESVGNFKSQGVTLCGDVLLVSAFVSYVGYFTKKYRSELMDKFWVPYVNNLKVRSVVLFMTREKWGGASPVGQTQLYFPLISQRRLGLSRV